MNVSGASGGTITLPSGTAVSFDPNALPHDAAVQISTIPSGSPAPANPTLSNVSATLHVAFLPVNPALSYAKLTPLAVRRTANASTSPQATFVIPGVQPGNWTYPVVNIGSQASPQYLAAIPQTTTSTNTTAFFLTGAVFKVLAPAIDVVMVAVSATSHQVVAPGLRYFDQTAKTWSVGAPPSVAQCVHPLLLLHGVFSDVEGTWNPQAVMSFALNGGYDCVLGYDYNWTDTVANVAPQIADAVNGLGFYQLDIAAHSYGTLMAIGVAPLLKVHEIQNMVLFQGPLNGSYLADPAMLLTLLTGLSPKNDAATQFSFDALGLGLVAGVAAINPSYFAQFGPGNPIVAGLKSTMTSAPNAPIRVIKAAGTVNYDFMAAAYLASTGNVMPPGDGVMSATSETDTATTGTASSATTGVPTATNTLYYSTTHTGLVPNAITISNNPAARDGFEYDLMPLLSVVVDNGDPNNYDIVKDSEGTEILKGVGSRDAFWVTGDTTATFGVSAESNPGDFSISPSSNIPEAAAPWDTATSHQAFVTLTKAGNTPINPSNPTDVLTIQVTNADGTLGASYIWNLFAMPDCGTCAGQSSSGLTRAFEAIRRSRSIRYTEMASKHAIGSGRR